MRHDPPPSRRKKGPSRPPRSPGARIERLLSTRLVERWPFERRARSTLLLDVDGAGTWTVQVSGRRVTLLRGRPRRPTATVSTPADVFVDVLEGRRSGVAAWFEGDLRVRGSIALAMKLEGLLDRPDLPKTFPLPKHVVVDSIDSFYIEAGDGDETVVLLHGLGATNASMLPTLWALAGRYRIIAPDFPGFGDSDKPVRPYHAGFYAKWAVHLLDRLGIDRAHFIGNSMGGRVSIEVALREPDRVGRLALYAPAVAMRRLRQFVPIVRIARPELAALPISLTHDAVRTVVELMFSDASRLEPQWFDAAADEFMRVFRTPRGRIAFFSAAREIYLDPPWGDRGFWKRLEKLSVPALFLWGDRDVLVPAGFSRHVEKSVPHARSIVLADTGHVPQFEHPELVHRLVRDFLAGHE